MLCVHTCQSRSAKEKKTQLSPGEGKDPVGDREWSSLTWPTLSSDQHKGAVNLPTVNDSGPFPSLEKLHVIILIAGTAVLVV